MAPFFGLLLCQGQLVITITYTLCHSSSCRSQEWMLCFLSRKSSLWVSSLAAPDACSARHDSRGVACEFRKARSYQLVISPNSGVKRLQQGGSLGTERLPAMGVSLKVGTQAQPCKSRPKGKSVWDHYTKFRGLQGQNSLTTAATSNCMYKSVLHCIRLSDLGRRLTPYSVNVLVPAMHGGISGATPCDISILRRHQSGWKSQSF